MTALDCLGYDWGTHSRTFLPRIIQNLVDVIAELPYFNPRTSADSVAFQCCLLCGGKLDTWSLLRLLRGGHFTSSLCKESKMAELTKWTVAEVIDGDTFRVTPDWVWEDERGDRVRPIGYDAPEADSAGSVLATTKLAGLILGKSVALSNVVGVDRGRLLCHVLIDGTDLASLFPEYE